MNYTTLANKEAINKVLQNFKPRNMEGHLVQTKQEALELIKQLIPEGSSIMNGASESLKEIGFVDYLKSGEHGWNNLHENILKESDPTKQAALRKQAILSDFYLGSVHALAETGEMIIASNTGSQLPHIVYTSLNLIFVVSTKKIVPTLADGFKRLEEHVIPLEDKRMQAVYGSGTFHAKTVIFHAESPLTKRNVHVILVEEPLGF